MRQDTGRLDREAEFFDRFYAENAATYDMAVYERYRRLSSRGLYSKEYRIAALGSLAGKRIVDIGCGTGENGVLLALLGANVTGIDVSPVAIDKARSLAESAGVADRVDFRVQPFESFEEGHGAFDVVWIDAFLHHMIPVFEDAVRASVALCASAGRVVITEPVRTSALARRLRPFFPAADATPDERPLEQGELDVIARHVRITDSRRFNGVARLSRFLLRDYSYESSSRLARGLSDSLARIDRHLLALSGVGPFLGGTLVLIGRPIR